VSECESSEIDQVNHKNQRVIRRGMVDGSRRKKKRVISTECREHLIELLARAGNSPRLIRQGEKQVWKQLTDEGLSTILLGAGREECFSQLLKSGRILTWTDRRSHEKSRAD
jgi:hypothetical protein